MLNEPGYGVDPLGAPAVAAERAVTILLLGDVAGDARVLKTTRSLRHMGLAVRVYCLTPHPSTKPLPDLQGATVQRVQAARPIARAVAFLRRLTRDGPAVKTAWQEPRLQSELRPTLSSELVSARRDSHPPIDDARRKVAGAASVRGTRARTRGTRMGPAARLVRDVRAFAGTLWLNLVLARAVTQPSTLIHANDLDTLLAGVLLRRRFGATLVYDSHELYPEMLGGVSPLYAGLWRLLEHHLIRRADAVITVNDSIADELERRHGLMRRPSVVLNCPPRDEPASISTGEEGGGIQLLYHGGFQRDRGLEELVGAMAHVDPGATLDLRGSGPLRDELRQLAVQHGVERRIRFLDPVPPDRLVAAMAGCAIGVVPYLPTSLNNYLCTPNKLFEYMMGGLAVVASDLPELRRIVCTHGVGIVYRAADARALAAAINGLLRDLDELARCRAAARRAALEHYNWEAQAAILRDAYLDLLGSS